MEFLRIENCRAGFGAAIPGSNAERLRIVHTHGAVSFSRSLVRPRVAAEE